MLTPTQYLQASGATAICLIQRDDDSACCFKVSRRGEGPDAVAVFWLDETLAVSVARIARRKAGSSPSLECAALALHQAAEARGTTLTPGHLALARATALSAKLDAVLKRMQHGGKLAEFNREYRRRRTSANLRGDGYMSFASARARLHRAIITRLAKKQPTNSPAELFLAVFGG